VRGFVDKNGRRVGRYSQDRQAGRQSWTGTPKRRPQAGAKLNKDGTWRNVAQTVTIPRTKRGRAKAARGWREVEDRDRAPGQFGLAGAFTATAGVLIVTTATGALVLLGAFIGLVGAALGAASLVMRVRAAAASEPPLCPTHSTGFNPKCSTCCGRYGR
jgi:hypothetical protein